jgi:hypothetical protein
VLSGLPDQARVVAQAGCAFHLGIQTVAYCLAHRSTQELIAPNYVEFFSKEMNCLGDKTSLENMLHETTGIPIEVFRTRSLVDYGVEQRLSWAAKRQTTREEDMAYCLIGILDIHLPLLYSEGRENAMNRLRKMAESAT